MDLTYKEKIIKLLAHDLDLKPKKITKHFFHLDCKISKKKFCTCCLFEANQKNLQMSNIIDVLSSNQFSFDLKENKINYNPSSDYESQKRIVLEEMIDNTEMSSINCLLNEFESNSLSKFDYRDIFEAIQADKKVCEQCNVSLMENNYHKGWKNPETGEYVLLCNYCVKKYISGSLEKSFDNYSYSYSKKEESSLNSSIFSHNPTAMNSYNGGSTNTLHSNGLKYENSNNHRSSQFSNTNGSNGYNNKSNIIFSSNSTNGHNNFSRGNEQVKHFTTKFTPNNNTQSFPRPNFQVNKDSSSQPLFLAQKRENPSINNTNEFLCSSAKCGKPGKKNDFLNCSQCNKNYHPYCSSPNLVMKYVSRFKWYCNDCKSCDICDDKIELNSNNSQDKQPISLLKCLCCDRLKHLTCMENESDYKEVNSNGIKTHYCNDCINCKNCDKTCSVPTYQTQNECHFIKGFRVCDKCWQNYKIQNYCPKCIKVYTSNISNPSNNSNNGISTEDSNTVYCRKCLSNYHIKCENLSQEEVNNMIKSKQNYTCSVCKEAEE